MAVSKSIPMNGKYVLDTTIVIKVFANDEGIMKRVKECSQIYIPSIVIGELYYGAYNSTKVKTNIKRIEQLIETCPILDCDVLASEEYGKIKRELKLKGTPIPENDIWIAAISIKNNIPLAGRDRHFRYIDGLSYQEW